MTDLKIGTSGYDYPDWKALFYPQDLKRQDFLAYYSEHFFTVELNFSYYRMPSNEQLARILERSEHRVDFSIKGHQSFTHKVDAAVWKDAVKEFRVAVAPLVNAKKLVAVLLQFPYSFHYNPENRQYLNNLIKALPGLPLVVEFRNSEWLNKRVFDALRERRVGYCSVDAPELKGLPGPLDIVTSDIAYIRFHGRNKQTWWGSDAAARFDYSYSNDELRPWVNRIINMLKDASRVRVYFNNHRRGQAPADADKLRQLFLTEKISVC